MNFEVQDMLRNTYNCIKKETTNPNKAWDTLIAFILANNNPYYLLQTYKELTPILNKTKLQQQLLSLYNNSLLRTDRYDHIGELYQNSNNYPLDKKLLSKQEINWLTQKYVPETNKKISILDPNARTGRLLIATKKRAPNAILFGITKNVNEYRIALANASIHKLPIYLIHVKPDALHSSHSMQINKHSWKHANQWHPFPQKN